MNFAEARGQVFEIDVRAVAGPEYAQISRTVRHRVHQTAAMIGVPFRRVRRTTIHLDLRLTNATSGLRRL